MTSTHKCASCRKLMLDNANRLCIDCYERTRPRLSAERSAALDRLCERMHLAEQGPAANPFYEPEDANSHGQ